MIGHHDIWIKYSKRLRAYSVCAAVVAAVITALQKFSLEDWGDHAIFSYFIALSHSHAKYIVPLCGVVIVLGQLSERIYGPPHIWATVHHLLNDLHDSIFPPDCNKAENRVTLFQAKQFYITWPWRAWPPWGCWLVPVERSHHMTRKSKACWRVTDDGNTEGVAGQAFLSRACVHVENLPNIAPDSGGKLPKLTTKMWFFKHFRKRKFLNDRQLKAITLYGERSWAKEKRLIKQKVAGKSLPRFLCGLPVDVSGDIWGVIVIDSRSGKLLDKQQIAAFFDKNAGIISKLLSHLK